MTAISKQFLFDPNDENLNDAEKICAEFDACLENRLYSQIQYNPHESPDRPNYTMRIYRSGMDSPLMIIEPGQWLNIRIEESSEHDEPVIQMDLSDEPKYPTDGVNIA